VHPVAKNVRAVELLVERPLAVMLAGCCKTMFDAGELVRLRATRAKFEELDRITNDYIQKLEIGRDAKTPVLGFWLNLIRPQFKPGGERSFVITPRRGLWHDGGYALEGVYDLSGRCSVCNVGAKQVRLLRFNARVLSKATGVVRTLSDEYLVSIDTAAKLARASLLSGHFLPVLLTSRKVGLGVEDSRVADFRLPIPEWLSQAQTSNGSAPDRWRHLGRFASPRVLQWLPQSYDSALDTQAAYADKLSLWAPRIRQPACRLCGMFNGNFRVSAMTASAKPAAGIHYCGRAIGFETGGLSRPSPELVCSEDLLAGAATETLRVFNFEECNLSVGERL
jgi:hypothetical protein